MATSKRQGGALATPPVRRNDVISLPRLSTEMFIQHIQDISGANRKTAAKIAEAFPSGQGLEQSTLPILRRHGATEAQAKKIKAAFELVRICDQACRTRSGTVRSPSDAARVIIPALERFIGQEPQEVFAVVLLDARYNVIDIIAVAIGTLSRVEVHPREIFKRAIQANAGSVIIAHNHPTGTATPSEADVDLTERMFDVGRQLGIEVADSIVVAGHGPQARSVSFAEAGIRPFGHSWD